MRENIGVASITFDVYGARILPVMKNSLDMRGGRRRASRTATLDGGCVVYDTGFAVADKSFRLETQIQHLEWLERMVRLYRLVYISTAEGFFEAIPAGYGAKDGRAWIDFDITKELT